MTKKKQKEFPRNGFESIETEKGTNKIGFISNNRQICLGTRGTWGTDYGAKSFAMFCLYCGHIYGANSGDVHLRRCTQCQKGKGEDLLF